jgi:hypothetical protein
MSFATADRFFFDDVDFLLADLEEVVKLRPKRQSFSFGGCSGMEDAICTHLGSSFNHDRFW